MSTPDKGEQSGHPHPPATRADNPPFSPLSPANLPLPFHFPSYLGGKKEN